MKASLLCQRLDVGSAAIIGKEAAGWTSGEGVDEHPYGEREQSLSDPLYGLGGCLSEVLFESHLAFEVGDRRLDNETQAQAILAGEVVDGWHAVGREDREPLQSERLATLTASQPVVGDQRAAGVGGRKLEDDEAHFSTRTGSWPRSSHRLRSSSDAVISCSNHHGTGLDVLSSFPYRPCSRAANPGKPLGAA